MISKRLTSVLIAVALSFSLFMLPASAVSDADSLSYYSVPPVSSCISLASTGEYTSILNTISTQLSTQTSYLDSIADKLQAADQYLYAIEKNTDRIKDYSSILSTISSSVTLLRDSVDAMSAKVATETTLSHLDTAFGNMFNFSNSVYDSARVGYVYWLKDETGARKYFAWTNIFSLFMQNLMQDTSLYGSRSIYGRIAQLQEVLASDDDKKLAESQKENREQIEQDFLSGSSGSTSLGKGDFGNLSSVGGTFKDTLSLNGTADIGNLSSGLTEADTTGQGWFSQATADSLDSVSGSTSSVSAVSMYSDDVSPVEDVDPYHMAGFEDNYAWLWGDEG